MWTFTHFDHVLQLQQKIDVVACRQLLHTHRAMAVESATAKRQCIREQPDEDDDRRMEDELWCKVVLTKEDGSTDAYAVMKLDDLGMWSLILRDQLMCPETRTVMIPAHELPQPWGSEKYLQAVAKEWWYGKECARDYIRERLEEANARDDEDWYAKLVIFAHKYDVEHLRLELFRKVTRRLHSLKMHGASPRELAEFRARYLTRHDISAELAPILALAVEDIAASSYSLEDLQTHLESTKEGIIVVIKWYGNYYNAMVFVNFAVLYHANPSLFDTIAASIDRDLRDLQEDARMMEELGETDSAEYENTIYEIDQYDSDCTDMLCMIKVPQEENSRSRTLYVVDAINRSWKGWFEYADDRVLCAKSYDKADESEMMYEELSDEFYYGDDIIAVIGDGGKLLYENPLHDDADKLMPEHNPKP
jgi:hypothetical protein